MKITNKRADEINVLWLSDFHIKGDYRFRKKFNQYITDFENQIKKLDIAKITHVIFTGDIARHALEDDYKLFKEKIYVFLKGELNKNVVYMFIPGNHDVQWDIIKDKVIDKFKSKAPGEIYEVIDEKTEANYDSFFSNYYKNDFIQENLKILNNNVGGKNPSIYGYFYDEKHNCLFILINSCYFSFGEPQRKELHKNLSFFYTDNYKSMVITENEISIQEYGNQTYILHLFEEKNYWDEIDNIMKNDPLVVSFSHHPPDWLHRKERFSLFIDQEPLIFKLFDRSNIHLVGHEHASTPGFKIKNCNVIYSGMFLDGSIETTSPFNRQANFPNNSFSILNVQYDLVKHTRYIYRLKSNNFRWEDYQDSFFIDRKKITKTISVGDNYRPNIISINPSDPYFYKFIRNKFTISARKKSLLKHQNGIAPHHYIYKPDKTSIHFIFSNLEELYSKNESGLIIKSSFIDSIINEIHNYKGNCNINISIFDFYTSKYSLYDIYDNDNDYKKLKIKIGEFDQERKLFFNIFKHFFFDYLIKNTEYPVFFALNDCNMSYHLIDNEFLMSFK